MKVSNKQPSSHCVYWWKQAQCSRNMDLSCWMSHFFFPGSLYVLPQQIVMKIKGKDEKKQTEVTWYMEK